MNKSKLGQRLLIYGAITLIYALVFKDVTAYGNIVNLELLSQRQNLVIVGALMVLIGAILAATSNSTGKVDASTEKSEDAPQLQPEAISKQERPLKERLAGLIQSINTWRPRIFFRTAFALACSSIFVFACSPQFNSPFILPFLAFLAQSMRNLPPCIAVGKTCFWAVVSILPFNIVHFLHMAVDEHEPVLAILPAVPTLILIGFFIKYSRS